MSCACRAAGRQPAAAGRGYPAGELALSAGQRLRAPEIALAAALGQASLPVFQRLSVGLFSTGDEVRDPGILLLPARSGTPIAGCCATSWRVWAAGSAISACLPDDAGAVEQALQAAAHAHDLLITSGGMSVGSEDHLGAVIRRRGTLDIWRLAVKPGKPVGFGDIDTCPILALPGNPIAAMVLFLVLGPRHRAAPRGRRHGAAAAPAPAGGLRYKKKPGRREYLLGRVDAAGQG